MNTLSPQQNQLIRDLLDSVQMEDLYREYAWGGDTWDAGFPGIVTLEQRIGIAARLNRLSCADILKIAEWGGYSGAGRIRCSPDPLVLPFFGQDPGADPDPAWLVRIIADQTTGLGPTYISRILRFARPSVYGAIDSRIVRVFGNGDPASGRFPILDLHAEPGTVGGWAIGRKNWPEEYGTWLAVLRTIAGHLNTENHYCPHPTTFLKTELRTWCRWLPADVEMALFAYATREITG